MFNLKNLLCVVTLMLLLGSYQVFAATPLPCHTELSAQKYDGGIVDIVQLRTGIRVEMSGHGYIHLSLSDNQGRNKYSTTVNALERNHFIKTEDLPVGQYRLMAYTQSGNFEFHIIIK